MRIREMKKEDAEQLLNVYRRFAKEYVGLASRDTKAYKRLLRRKENLGWVALNKKGNIIGYVAARFDKRKREARITEIVIDPEKDFEQIAKLLIDKAHESLLKKNPAVISAASMHNPLYTKIFPKLDFFGIKSKDVFMYAILDVPKFLTEISSILANRIKQLKQRNILLQLECEEHSLFIRKQQENIERLIWTNQAPDFKIMLGRELLTKLLFGIVDPTESFQARQLQIETTLNEKETSQVLTTIFPKRQFLILDFW
jgi:predicted acetyltransferase